MNPITFTRLLKAIKMIAETHSILEEIQASSVICPSKPLELLRKQGAPGRHYGVTFSSFSLNLAETSHLRLPGNSLHVAEAQRPMNSNGSLASKRETTQTRK
jgi:hypothetical protein